MLCVLTPLPCDYKEDKHQEIFLCNIAATCQASTLKVQSCKLCNNKHMTASTQITNTEMFAFISVLVSNLFNRKVLVLNRFSRVLLKHVRIIYQCFFNLHDCTLKSHGSFQIYMHLSS